MPDDPSPEGAGPDGTSLAERFAEISNVAKGVGATAVVVQSTILVALLVPDQLGQLEPVGPVVCVFGLLMSWAVHGWLDKHLPGVVGLAAIAVVALLIVNLAYVQTVSYTDGDRHFLVGYALDQERLEEVRDRLPPNLDPTEMEDRERIIREFGPAVIRDFWNGYTPVAIGYVLLYTLFAFTGAMSFGGIANRSLKHGGGPDP